MNELAFEIMECLVRIGEGILIQVLFDVKSAFDRASQQNNQNAFKMLHKHLEPQSYY